LAPSAFTPGMLRHLAELQDFAPPALIPAFRYAIIGFSPVFFIAVPWLLWTALRGCRRSWLVVGLLLFQGGLVAWKLGFDFRFLGGLEYVAVLAAALTMTTAEDDPPLLDSPRWARSGDWLVRSRHWALFVAAIPWLGAQMYYARPFAGVVTGLTPRNQFLERYVALTRDFEILDQMLPKDAVLYIYNPYERLPNFYAPRPVVLTPLDLGGRKPVYRLSLEPAPDVEEINATSFLSCGEVMYSNERAITDTFRTPGEAPVIGPVRVQSCQVQPVGAGR
jgi:hypothetical protein